MQRNLLRTEVGKRLIWNAKTICVPDSKLAQLQVEDDMKIAHLLDTTKQERPELWLLLNEAISWAHSARRKWDDSFSER